MEDPFISVGSIRVYPTFQSSKTRTRLRYWFSMVGDGNPVGRHAFDIREVVATLQRITGERFPVETDKDQILALRRAIELGLIT